MLVCLHIENIAVIEKADVEFDKGFSVLTGETGAGKSILIDSINAVLGERTSKELIRTGCEKAVVSASFCNISSAVKSKLSELGFDLEDDELIISRILTESKSSAKINGQPATAAIIREIAPMLVDIHGQHDSQALLMQEKHYTYIDSLAKNSDILNQYAVAFKAMQSTRKQIKKLTESLEDKEKRIELLEFQINELEKADIKVGERQKLTERRDVINNMQSITDALYAAHIALCGDDAELQGAVSLAISASEQLTAISNIWNNSAEVNDQLSNAVSLLQDVKSGIDKLLSDIDFNKDELQSVEERLDMYYRLSLKYGADEQQMLNFLQDCKNELKTIVTSDEEIVKLSELLQQQVSEVKRLGAKLTDSRKAAGEFFAKEVAAQLEYLNMPSVKIIVDITDCAYSLLGANRVEFLISTNPGEPPKPLSKIASGGEMSRIMLAIKNVLAHNDPVDTLIFDEIDTGISGKAAQKVGYKLKQTADGKQVICVTHLAQIAALADTHLLIEKNIESGRATTTITPLDYNGRRYELARIIGSDVTDSTLKSAEEMLRY